MAIEVFRRSDDGDGSDGGDGIEGGGAGGNAIRAEYDKTVMPSALQPSPLSQWPRLE